MSPDAYFSWILIILTVLIFIALILGFLYLVYGKEENAKETQFSLALFFVTQGTRLNKRTVKVVDNKIAKKACDAVSKPIEQKKIILRVQHPRGI